MANVKYLNRICVKGRNAVVGQTYSNESVAGKVRMLQKWSEDAHRKLAQQRVWTSPPKLANPWRLKIFLWGQVHGGQDRIQSSSAFSIAAQYAQYAQYGEEVGGWCILVILYKKNWKLETVSSLMEGRRRKNDVKLFTRIHCKLSLFPWILIEKLSQWRGHRAR